MTIICYLQWKVDYLTSQQFFKTWDNVTKSNNIIEKFETIYKEISKEI
jgi:hypothetical protein